MTTPAAQRSCRSPHAAHLGADIDTKACVGPALAGRRSHDRPRHTVEKRQQIGGDESRARGIDVAVPLRMLAMREEALRQDEMQTVSGPGHGDIEQSALLLYLRRGSRREV